MDPAFLQIVIFGVLAAVGNILGGLVLFPTSVQGLSKRYLKHLLAIGSGFMLAVTLVEILPRTITIWRGRGWTEEQEIFFPMVLLLGGYLLTQFLEHAVAPHFHLGERVHSEETISPKRAFTAVGGMGLHTFFDGVMIAAASQIDARVGLLVFLAVIMHKFPEGFTVGSMVLAAGKSRASVVLSTALLGLTTLFGVFIFHLIGDRVVSLVAYALPVAAGVTLYVAASDLIPEVNHHGGAKFSVSLYLFLGVGLFFLAHFLLHSTGLG